MNKSTVSVVIPVKNRKKMIISTLDSLLKQSLIPKDVIVIDDNSTDGTWENLLFYKETNETPFNFVLLQQSTNSKGPAAARNLGINNTDTELVAFTDSDCIADSKWLENLVNPLIKENNDEKIIGVGGIVKTYKKDIIGLFYEIMGILNPPQNLLYLVTANCCYKKSALDEINGFNEDFYFAGGEDTDLSFRLQEKGYRFKLAKDAIIFHNFSSNFKDLIKTFIRYGRGSLIVNKQKKEMIK